MLRKLKHWVEARLVALDADHSVRADEEGLTCIDDQGVVSRIKWAGLISIRVVPLGARPGADAMLWALTAGTELVTFPDNARGATEVIRRLVCLPGFDTVRYERADACSSPEGLVVWQSNTCGSGAFMGGL